jgi:opacity protein-like surface antigen
MRRLTRAALLVLALTAVGFGTLVVQPSEAVAQGTEETIEGMLEQAINDYDVLQIADSKKKLNDAIELARSEGVSGPVVADVYVMLGIVEYADSRDKAQTKEYFLSALREDRSAEIDPVYQSPTLVDVMEEARNEVGPAPPDGGDSGDGGEATVSGFEHEPVVSARAGEPLELEAFMPPDMPVYRVYAYYRHFGEDEYEKLEMSATSATRFAVDIPKDQVRTSQIDYFIEAEDRAGSVLANAGSANTPFNITILGSGDIQPPDGGDGGDGRDGGDGGDGGDEPVGPSDKVAYMNLSGGTGIGFLGGGEPTARPNVPVKGGVAPAFAHGLLDAGYIINKKSTIGLYFRWQFSPAQDFEVIPEQSKEATGFPTTKQECLGLGLPGDCLLGVKYRYFFQNNDTLRLYSSGGAGVGRVRHWIRLKQYITSETRAECADKEKFSDARGEYCYVRDTVRSGWAHAGAGLGIEFPLSENVALAGDAFLYLLVPEVAFNLDASAGLHFRF